MVQAINTLGFGKFQVKLSLFTGLCWMVDSMEITILSILSPSLHCDWGISRYQQALTTTVTVINLIIILVYVYIQQLKFIILEIKFLGGLSWHDAKLYFLE